MFLDLFQFTPKTNLYQINPSFSKVLESANPAYYIEDFSLGSIEKELSDKQYLPERIQNYLKNKEKDVSRKREKNISEIFNFSDLKEEYKGLIFYLILKLNKFVKRD